MNIDASAAKGITERLGLCKVRHLETPQLWIQQFVAKGLLVITKMLGTENPDDLMTKHLPSETIAKHCKALSRNRHGLKHSSGFNY